MEMKWDINRSESNILSIEVAQCEIEEALQKKRKMEQTTDVTRWEWNYEYIEAITGI